jgi:hypothetical protein
MKIPKKIVAALALILLTGTNTRAETVVFTEAQTKSPLAYYAVWIGGAIHGYTDGQGRIRIDSPTGEFEVILKYNGKPDRTLKITTTGKPGIMPVEVN